MSSPTVDLPTALAEVIIPIERPGGFQVSGSFDIHPPRLEVDGVGVIALPLLPFQAEALVAAAEQAPYGRGTETLVDTTVRRTWQVDAARVHLTGARWAADLAAVVARVREGLAVTAGVEARLYKLLVYDTGGFFIPHRDTEKEPGMFATLVIVLPCDYSGGELIVRHRGEEARIDLHRNEPSEAAFAAFYADCVHEVLPIASGHRLALVYNLVRSGPGPLPAPPDYGPIRARIGGLLAAWGQDATAPAKLVCPLEHAYTEAEIAFDALKGRDAALAQSLAEAAAAADCDLHLALLTVAESGWAEYSGDRWDDPDMVIGEVTESSFTLEQWRTPEGGRPGLGPLGFDEGELVPPGALDDREDTEPEFSEATGNAGASFERLYQRAALVLWPRGRRAVVLTGGGLAVSIPALLELVRRWEGAGAVPGDSLWHEGRELAAAIRDAWPREPWARRRASEGRRTRDLFAAQLRLGDLEACADFIAGPVADGAYGPEDNPPLAQVLGLLPGERAGALLTVILEGNGPRLPGACAGLLARCAKTDPQRHAALVPAARLLAEGLTAPQWPGSRDVDGHASAPQPLTAEHLADALRGLARIHPGLALDTVRRLLAAPDRFPMDPLLLPAALLLHQDQAPAGHEPESDPEPEPEAMAALRSAVVAHLDARIALPLEPPADWTRDASLPCHCGDCTRLATFLASPGERVWLLKAAQDARTHVEHVVQRARADLDLTTERQGRPYSLVCTKNQASYQRRVRQRDDDLVHRGRLAWA